MDLLEVDNKFRWYCKQEKFEEFRDWCKHAMKDAIEKSADVLDNLNNMQKNIQSEIDSQVKR